MNNKEKIVAAIIVLVVLAGLICAGIDQRISEKAMVRLVAEAKESARIQVLREKHPAWYEYLDYIEAEKEAKKRNPIYVVIVEED